MSANNNYEYGYESLLTDFKRYQKQTPRGVGLKRNRQTINLQFKIGDSKRSLQGCNCSFTLDGMVNALSKAHKVAEKLKEDIGLTEFWDWYNKEIKDIGKVENDLLTFSEAIAVVSKHFWSGLTKLKEKRDKNEPSHQSSWSRTYNEYYKHLPQNEPISKKAILDALNRWEQGTKSFKDAMSAYRALARLNGQDRILKELLKINSTQTIFAKLQDVTVEDFINWRNELLGITKEMPKRANLDIRESWVWVFGMQILYCLRINEVFAIKNLNKPAYDPETNKLIVHAYNDIKNNPHRLIYIGRKTNIGTTVKTGSRLARPMIPPKYPTLYTDWNLQCPKLPDIKPKKGSQPETITGFHHRSARKRLKRWKAPFTQTHADRNLGNLLGLQAGIPVEVRAQSMGHTVIQNTTNYMKRQGIQTQIDVLTQSNKQAIDFTSGIIEAKRVIEKFPNSQVAIVELLAKVYQKSELEIEQILE